MGLKPAALTVKAKCKRRGGRLGEGMARQLITVEGVDRSFGPVDVLQDVNLVVNHGERIGIVGHNGAGKTTLLNTISDQKQDVGDVDFAPGLRIAYLTQIRDLESDRTIEEELSRKGRQFQELEEEIAAIEAQMVDPAFYESDWEPVMERYTELQQTLPSRAAATWRASPRASSPASAGPAPHGHASRVPVRRREGQIGPRPAARRPCRRGRHLP